MNFYVGGSTDNYWVLLDVEDCSYGFRSTDEALTNDYEISEYLGIEWEYFIDILLSYGASQNPFFIESQYPIKDHTKNYNDCYFKNKQDVEKAIELLETYLVMIKLTEV